MSALLVVQNAVCPTDKQEFRSKTRTSTGQCWEWKSDTNGCRGQSLENVGCFSNWAGYEADERGKDGSRGGELERWEGVESVRRKLEMRESYGNRKS